MLLVLSEQGFGLVKGKGENTWWRMLPLASKTRGPHWPFPAQLLDGAGSSGWAEPPCEQELLQSPAGDVWFGLVQWVLAGAGIEEAAVSALTRPPHRGAGPGSALCTGCQRWHSRGRAA